MTMTYRVAELTDIPQIQEVRHSVKENTLSDPGLVTDEDCREFLSRRGKGWVCLDNGKLVGFAIADLRDDNIWALFLRPEYEGRGIGKHLQQLMLDWYFAQGKDRVWLSTAAGTRAAGFYVYSGWQQQGWYSEKELKFELSREQWELQKQRPA